MTTAQIGNLRADLDLETASFDKNTAAAERHLRSNAAKMNRSLAKVERGFDLLGRKAEKALSRFGPGKLAATVTASAAAFALLSRQSLVAGAEIGKSADVAGLAVDQYQRMTFASRELRVSNDALVDGFKELNLRAAEFVRRGTGSSAEAFQILGLSQADVNARLGDTVDLFDEVIRRTQDLDRASRILVLDEIFGGTAGEQFIRFVEEGIQSVRALREEADRTGLVIDTALIRNADQASRRMERLSQAISIKVTAAVLELAPQLNSLFEGLLKVLPEVIAKVERLAKGLGFIEDTSDRTELLQRLEEQSAATDKLTKARERLARLTKAAADAEGPALTKAATQAQDLVNKLEAQVSAIEARIAVLRRNLGEVGDDGVTRITVNPEKTDGKGGKIPPAAKQPRAPNVEDLRDRADERATEFLLEIDRQRQQLFESEIERIRRELAERLRMLETLALSEEERAAARVQLERNAAKEIANEQEKLQEKVLQQIEREAEERERALERQREQVEDFNETVLSSGLDAVERLASGYGNFRDVALSVLKDVLNAWLKLNDEAQSSLGGGGGGFGGILGDILGGIFSGTPTTGNLGGLSGAPFISNSLGTFTGLVGRAGGGDVGADTPYMVGEKGREIFVPRSDGTVLPAHVTRALMGSVGGAGGPSSVTQHINVQPDVPMLVRAEITRLMPDISRMAAAWTQDERQREPGYFGAVGA